MRPATGRTGRSAGLMPKTAPITVEVTGLPETKAAIAEAVAAERRRLVLLVRNTCACPSCKNGIEAILTAETTEGA